MSRSKACRWRGSSTRKLRKRPTKFLSLLMRCLHLTSFTILCSFSQMKSYFSFYKNSLSRSCSWSKLKKISGKNTNTKSAKSKYARCNFLYTFLYIYFFGVFVSEFEIRKTFSFVCIG